MTLGILLLWHQTTSSCDQVLHYPPGVFVQDLYWRRWWPVQYMADVFWKRWLAEYLPCLRERQKWLTPKVNINVGDLVLLLHENFPRSHWPLGLIISTYPSPDDIVRSVQVKTEWYLWPTNHKIVSSGGVRSTRYLWVDSWDILLWFFDSVSISIQC